MLPDDQIMEKPNGWYAENEAMLAAATTLLRLLPKGEDHIEFQGNFLASRVAAHAFMVRKDGERVPVTFPEETFTTLATLRNVMYKPGVGTWFSIRMNVYDDGSIQVVYNHKDEPSWRISPDPVDYVTDQHVYPIDEENQPEWLKQRVAEGRRELCERDPGNYPEWLTYQIAQGNKPDWLIADL